VSLNDVLLTVEQAAEFAGVRPATIRYWRRNGILPVATRTTYQGRRRVFFTRGAVETVCRVTCPWCGSTFKRSNLRQAYCCPGCRKAAYRFKTEQEAVDTARRAGRESVLV